MKNSFILYTEDIDNLAEELSEEAIGRLIIAINKYVKTQELPDFIDPIMSMAFKFIKNKLDKDLNKWEQIKQARSEAGKKGGAPKGNSNAKKKSIDNYEEKQTKQAKQTKQTKQAEYVTVTVTDNVINNNINNTLPQTKKQSAIVSVKKNIHKEVYEYFANKYKAHTGIDYMPDTKDFVLLADLLKQFKVEIVKRKIDWLEIGCVKGVFWFAKNINDFNIGKLHSQWNLILPQLTEEQKKQQEEQRKDEEMQKRVMANIQKRRQQNGISVK